MSREKKEGNKKKKAEEIDTFPFIRWMPKGAFRETFMVW